MMKLRYLIASIGLLMSFEILAAEVARVIVKPPRAGVLPAAPKDIFYSLRINVGTVVSVEANKKARIPACILQLKFDKPYLSKLKQSSAQLVDRYSFTTGGDKPCLKDMQLAAVTNFPKANVGVPSFFLVLGVVGQSEQDGGTLVLTPSKYVSNGARVVLLDSKELPSDFDAENMKIIEFKESFEKLDFRVGTVTDAQNSTVDFGELGKLSLKNRDYDFQDGMQVIRIFNLSDEHNTKDNLLGVIEGGRKIPLTVQAKVPNGYFVL